MPSKHYLEQQCRRVNKKNRLVKDNYRYNLDKFVDNSHGNFYISGNDINTRNDLLLRFIRKISRENNYPILILSNSHNSDQITNLIRNDINERLVHRNGIAYTSQCPTYDPLYDLTPKKLKTIIREIGLANNYNDIFNILTYFDAIIEILSKINKSKPYSFRKLIEKSNYEIEELGRRYRASSNAVDNIFTYKDEDAALKQIVNRIYTAFGRISRLKSTDPHSISNLLSENRIIILEYNSIDQEVFDLILSKILTDYNYPVNLIFDNIHLSKNSPLLETLNFLADNFDSNVGISTKDIMSWLNTTKTDTNRNLPDFPTKFVDTSSIASSSINGYLEQFGQYQEAYVAEGGHKRIFQFVPDSNYQLAYKPANRIKIEDVNTYKILLTGHNGQIIDLVETI